MKKFKCFEDEEMKKGDHDGSTFVSRTTQTDVRMPITKQV